MQEPSLHKYKLTISYDGTRYSGWQVQPNGSSIQECIQSKLGLLTGTATGVTGAGRTDAGVHANGQVAHFTCERTLDLYTLKRGLNGLLPKDIRIKDASEVPLSFHARYSAISKSYHYHLHLDAVEDPFHRLYRWHLFQKVDIALLRGALSHFVGTHDFSAFANEAHRGSAARDAVRTIQRLELVMQEGGVRLEFTGDGFLYKMVRNIVGTLVEIASGKRPEDDIPRLLASKQRTLAGRAAPPHGLFLVGVEYPG
jgi:tRNA pseudouridine38-40 synthase